LRGNLGTIFFDGRIRIPKLIAFGKSSTHTCIFLGTKVTQEMHMRVLDLPNAISLGIQILQARVKITFFNI